MRLPKIEAEERRARLYRETEQAEIDERKAQADKRERLQQHHLNV